MRYLEVAIINAPDYEAGKRIKDIAENFQKILGKEIIYSST